MKKYLLILVIVGCLHGCIVGEKIIKCYYDACADHRPSNGKFEPNHIDPNLCTHLSYSFFDMHYNGELKSPDSYLDFHPDSNEVYNLKSTVFALKYQNPKLKVSAVVGGWKDLPLKLSKMAADPLKRARFISSVLKFIREHGLDGLDLDWEYPTQSGGIHDDRHNFVLLLKELNAAFKSENLLLGIVVSAKKDIAEEAYDIPNITKYVDFIDVMTFHLSDPWPVKLHMNAPLRGNEGADVQSAIAYWLAKGAPAHKLLLGIAFYGISYTTASSIVPGSFAGGPGRAGSYTGENGILGYNEICESMESWTVKRDVELGVPYAYKRHQWVSYDDVESIGLKMDFLKSMNLGGVMISSIDTDDFRGICGKRYPLLRAINRALKGESFVEGKSEKTVPVTVVRI